MILVLQNYSGRNVKVNFIPQLAISKKCWTMTVNVYYNIMYMPISSRPWFNYHFRIKLIIYKSATVSLTVQSMWSCSWLLYSIFCNLKHLFKPIETKNTLDLFGLHPSSGTFLQLNLSRLSVCLSVWLTLVCFAYSCHLDLTLHRNAVSW